MQALAPDSGSEGHPEAFVEVFLSRADKPSEDNMLNPITSATQPQATAQPTAAPRPAPQPKPQIAAVTTDTVKISAAAQAMQQAMQEVLETPAQTAKEATGGDIQAKHLLAKEAAAKSNG